MQYIAHSIRMPSSEARQQNVTPSVDLLLWVEINGFFGVFRVRGVRGWPPSPQIDPLRNDPSSWGLTATRELHKIVIECPRLAINASNPLSCY